MDLTGLAAGRRPPGSSLLGVSSPWLFPGRQPGSALTEDALAQRLHALEISPRQRRSTALFTLAADVPAAILAKTLGIHVQAAIQWQKISAGDWAAYAADVSSRTRTWPRRSPVSLVTGDEISSGIVMASASRPEGAPGRPAADPPS